MSRWKGIGFFVSSQEYRELYDDTGEPVVFEWKMFPGHTTTQLFQEVQTLMDDEIKVKPQNFQDRLIFMSIFNDID